MQIILDISANTHKNNEAYYRKMIEDINNADIKARQKQLEIGARPEGHDIIIKGQLFHRAGKNIPQDYDLFERMANWAYEVYNYKTTASVFDRVSLDLLLLMDIPYELPFVKIANRRDLDWLIGEIPRKIPVYRSISPATYFINPYDGLSCPKDKNMVCVSKYPADITDYPPWEDCGSPLSDHTVGLELVKRWKPTIWEKHLKLEDSTGLDAGPWAITPEELGCILADLALR